MRFGAHVVEQRIAVAKGQATGRPEGPARVACNGISADRGRLAVAGHGIQAGRQPVLHVDEDVLKRILGADHDVLGAPFLALRQADALRIAIEPNDFGRSARCTSHVAEWAGDAVSTVDGSTAGSGLSGEPRSGHGQEATAD